MEKTTQYVLLAAVIVLVGAGFYVGRVTAPKQQAQPQVISLTEAQRDSLDAEWRKKVSLIHHGTIIRKGKTDTSYIYVNDTTEVSGLYRLIEALTAQSQPEFVPNAEPIIASKQHKWGIGVGGGAIYGCPDARVTPLGLISIEHAKNEALLLAGYRQGWQFGIAGRRRF